MTGEETTGGEIGAFTTLLDQLDLREVLISADALHTQVTGMPVTCTSAAGTS